MKNLLARLKLSYARNELDLRDLAASWFRLSPVNTLVHCGAFDGEESKLYDLLKISRRIWIDANPLLVKSLKSKFGDEVKDQVLEAALWDRDCEKLDFYFASNLASSSLLRPKDHLTYVPSVTFTSSIRISSQTLDSLLHENHLLGQPVDLLILDLQGAEYRALKGAQKTMCLTNFIYLEVSNHELYVDSPRWKELTRLLAVHDFQLVDWSYSKFHYWGNALYAKREICENSSIKFTRFRRLYRTFLRMLFGSLARKLWHIRGSGRE